MKVFKENRFSQPVQYIIFLTTYLLLNVTQLEETYICFGQLNCYHIYCYTRL